MSKDLRKKLIHLAHQKPELRSDILPLLGKEATETFDLETYKKQLLKDAGNFLKTNQMQQKMWKDSYVAVVTLYDNTYDKEQKKRIANVLSDLKSNVLTHLNSEKNNIEQDILAIYRLKFGYVELTRELIKGFQSENIRNSATYYLDRI